MTVQRIDSWPEGMPRTTVKRLDGREAGENWVCYLGGGRFYDVHADRYWKDMTVAHPLWGEDVEAITCRDLLDEIAFMDSYTLSRVAEHLRFVCADGVVEYDDDTEVMAIVESGLPRPESLLPKPPVAEPDSVDADLDGRMKRYGVFAGQAKISQSLKIAMWEAPSWHLLPEDMREALEMVQHKVARILNGDPQYADNWHDIAGYARLVERRILKNEKGGCAMIPILAMQAPDFPQRVKQQALAITFDVIDRRAFIYIRGHGFAQIDMPSDPTFAVFIEALLQGGNHA